MAIICNVSELILPSQFYITICKMLRFISKQQGYLKSFLAFKNLVFFEVESEYLI